MPILGTLGRMFVSKKKQKNKNLKALFCATIWHEGGFFMATYHLRVKNDTKSGGRKVSAKRHADYIFREDGKSHADYINREGAQSNRTDCIFKGSQLPKWAEDSPQKFFSAATRYEDKGNRRYKEIELSLPNELTLEQNREIVDRFIANHLSNHYYAYAIHEKKGELSGERTPHVHIMFSERLIDGVERMSERPAYKYFRRAAKPLKGEKIASFERRREHGAPKDKKWHDKKYLCEMRADFARIQNDVLKKNGFSIRVDHRTLQAQKEEAAKNGDEFLTKLYKRVPEAHIGVVAAHQESASANEVKKYREVIHHKQHSLFQVDINQKATAEGETLFSVNQAESANRALMNSQAYRSANLDDESLRLLNQEIVAGLTRIRELKRDLVGGLRARQRAQKEYLSTADYQFIRDYESKLNQRVYLERLLHEFALSSWQYPDNERALRYIERLVKEKNSKLHAYLAQQNPHYWAIQEKLQNPYQRKNIELIIHGFLQDDLKILAELKKTSDDVLQKVAVMRNMIELHETFKTTFTLSEIRDNIRNQYLSLKKQYEDAVDTKNFLMLKQVSPLNALLRAKNIFVHGGFDKLQSLQASYKETLAQFERDKSEYLHWEQSFNDKNWISGGDRLREQYYLTKKKIHLENIERNLSATKIRMDTELARLENLCQTEKAQEKIALFAASILHKNLKITQEYEETKKLVTDLSTKLQVAKKRFKALNDNYASMKKSRLYRVIQPVNDSAKTTSVKENELAAIIADALMGEPYAVQLVARFDGNNLEMDKDWEMMTEFDRDELINKKIIREL